MRRIRQIAVCIGVVLRTKLAAQMAYRGHFFLSVGLLVIGDLLLPLATLLVYRSGASFPGWTLHEALLIQGTFALARGIAFPFFFGMISSNLTHVREGTFDLLLLRPRSTLFMAMLTGMEPFDFGRLLSGGVLFGYALTGIPSPSPAEWLGFAALFAASLTVLCAFSLFFSGLLFRWVGSSRVYDIFDAFTSFGMYPGTIFAKSFQQFITYVIPVGIIAFAPASALLGRAGWQIAGGGAVALLFLAAGLGYWHMMLRSYTSAGG